MEHYRKYWGFYVALAVSATLGMGAQLLGPQLAEFVAWSPLAATARFLAKVVVLVSSVVFIVVSLYLRSCWLRE